MPSGQVGYRSPHVVGEFGAGPVPRAGFQPVPRAGFQPVPRAGFQPACFQPGGETVRTWLPSGTAGPRLGEISAAARVTP